jgi:hypothetical protein
LSGEQTTWTMYKTGFLDSYGAKLNSADCATCRPQNKTSPKSVDNVECETCSLTGTQRLGAQPPRATE